MSSYVGGCSSTSGVSWVKPSGSIGPFCSSATGSIAALPRLPPLLPCPAGRFPFVFTCGGIYSNVPDPFLPVGPWVLLLSTCFRHLVILTTPKVLRVLLNTLRTRAIHMGWFLPSAFAYLAPSALLSASFILRGFSTFRRQFPFVVFFCIRLGLLRFRKTYVARTIPLCHGRVIL